MSHVLDIKPLTKAAFAPFGDVVETDGANHFTINQGFAERYGDLANVDVTDGATSVNIFEAKPRILPMKLLLMERHPLGSQMFYPLQDKPWIVVICGDPRDAASYRAFRASGRQGVNYARGCWHHPLVALDGVSRFLIVDRKGGGNNLEEMPLNGVVDIEIKG